MFRGCGPTEKMHVWNRAQSAVFRSIVHLRAAAGLLHSQITDIYLFSVSSIIPPCFPFTYYLQSSLKQDANSQSWLYRSRFSSEKHHRWRENNWFVRETKRSSDGGVHWLLPRLSRIIVRQVRLMIRCEERWCYFIPPPAAGTLPLKEGLTFVVAPLRVHPVQTVK